MAEKKIELPDGLDWETLKSAVEIIEEWEINGSDSGVDLAISLYRLFRATPAANEIWNKQFTKGNVG